MTTREILGAFHGLYAGGYAQHLREAGNSNAMPPWAETFWLGKQVVKCPMDLWVYQEIIVETKPDLLIETGTNGAGAAWFFATIMDLIGHGQVITVDKDKYPELWKPHARIQYLVGDSSSEEIASQIRPLTSGKTVMLSLDSLHTYDHVRKELSLYGNLVTKGCYAVVDDTGFGNPEDVASGQWCDRAVKEFTAQNPHFIPDYTCEKHLLTSNHGGWLKRVL